MRISTNVNPLITNFMKPRTPEVLSASNVTMIYDPQTQTTMYMGGNSGGSRSNYGYKETRTKQSGGYYSQNDHSPSTDD